jgi:hypothetical protein
MNRLATIVAVLVAVAIPSRIRAQIPLFPPRDAPARAQPMSGTATLIGTVTTDDPDRAPVPRARVLLNSLNRSTPGHTQTTDDRGQFAFINLPAGAYNLSATKPGFVPSNYGARRPDRPGTPINVTEGQHVSGLTMRLVHGGVITGTVRDHLGDPMPGVLVDVLRYTYAAGTGERTLGHETISSFRTTDDRGMYRAWGLPPGEYAVMARPSVSTPGSASTGVSEMRRLSAAEVDRMLTTARAGSLASHNADPPSMAPRGTAMTYAPIFYPSTPEVAFAGSISLSSNEERDGIDVTMVFLPTVRVGGSVRIPQGAPSGPIEVRLEKAGAQTPISGVQGGVGASTTTSVNSNGRFAFFSVVPGHYTVLAMTSSAPPAGVSDRSRWYALEDVVVDAQDLDITLDLQPSMAIDGRMLFEGSSPPPQNLRDLRVVLVPRGSGGNLGGGPPGGQVGVDGTFEFRDVTPGTYSPIMLSTGPAIPGPWTMKASVLNGVDALDLPVEIKSNQTQAPGLQWLMTFGDQPATLAGVLRDASGRAATDYFVVAFPVDRTRWVPRSSRVRSVRPATDGQFSMGALAPGEYFVAALTDLAPGELNDAAFLASLVNTAVKVTLTEGQTTTQNLELAGR